MSALGRYQPFADSLSGKISCQNWAKERGVGATLQKVVKITRQKTQPHLIK